jgi:hypothetical protein
MIPTARDIPPTQPSARQDALYPKRGPSNSLYLPLGEWPRLPWTARINDPSKLARYSSHGMAPVLVPLRPSSEHILIVRAPGARDRHGVSFHPFHRARSASKKGTWPLPPCWRTFSASCESCCCAQQTQLSSPPCDTPGYLSAYSRGSASSEPIPPSSYRLRRRPAESDGCSI